MSKQKFTLPHSEQKIGEMEERYRKLRVEIDEMNRENWLAQQAENIRKASIMTPGMMKVLDKMAKDGTVSIRELRYSGKRKASINISVFDRLRQAEFIGIDNKQSNYKINVYVITNLGREALAAAKKQAAKA